MLTKILTGGGITGLASDSSCVPHNDSRIIWREMQQLRKPSYYLPSAPWEEVHTKFTNVLSWVPQVHIVFILHNETKLAVEMSHNLTPQTC